MTGGTLTILYTKETREYVQPALCQAEQQSSRSAEQQSNRATEQQSNRATEQPVGHVTCGSVTTLSERRRSLDDT
jgi:hypothetical protein